MRKYTVLFIIMTVIVIAAFDFWIIAQGGKESSISWVVIQWSHEYPSIPFLCGFVCGHLFWRMDNPTKDGE